MDPVVFISSTAEDLKGHRIKAADAVRASRCSLRWMEDFASRGDKLTLSACKEMVEEAEVVVVLVAHRYGWVPDDPENPDSKSITWLECDHARQAGKEVIAFLVDPNCPWRAELKEDYRLTEAKNQPARRYNQIRKEVLRNERKLAEFKEELSIYPRRKFTDVDNVYAVVLQALLEWRHKRYPAQDTAPASDPNSYLQALEEDTRQIRIKHLKTRRAEPYFFGIDKIYIPLTTATARYTPRKGAPLKTILSKRIMLEQELSNPKVVIVGHAGSGKSTFLRRVAFELCRNLRGTRPADAAPFLAPNDKRFPILIRIADFAVLLDAERKKFLPESEEWIPYYLGRKHGDEALFRRKLQQDACLVMLDGLDEAPNVRMRTRIARLFENAAKKYSRCHWLVSTRPRSYEGDTVLEGFQEIRIDDLQRPEINIFLDQFAQALELNPGESKAFKDGLDKAFDTRPEIGEMGRNPLMLTALAILQHGGGKMPEYRYELYESILVWLAQAREEKEGRLPDKQCLLYLRRLALAMQDTPKGRLRQINRRVAAELLSREFGGAVEENEDLLEQETHDSGIITSVGRDLEFWHLSLQEYLAAKEISGLTDIDLVERVVASGKLYDPEWREMMRLLGGVLCGVGEPKIEALFQAILDQLGELPMLANQVRCVALLSAMMQDLSSMKYKPKTEAYEPTVKSVMGIFKTGEADRIDIKTRIEAADLLGKLGDPRLEEDNWVRIPPGSFHMGAQKWNERDRNYDPEARHDEGPVHEVTLGEFRIRRFPVTAQEFTAFMAKDGYSERQYWMRGGSGKFKESENWELQKLYPTRPVVGVSWFEAAAYCSWAGGRLPTEPEWERAARGPASSRYPWGNAPPLDASRANHNRPIGRPTPVGLFPDGNSTEGLCDLLGNVFEWCEEDPVGPKDGNAKMLRGGSWNDDPRVVRVSFRISADPADRNGFSGFRCAGDVR